MVQTTHGWTIPGTAHPEVDQVRARCGGLNSCPLCMEEAEQFVQNLMKRNEMERTRHGWPTFGFQEVDESVEVPKLCDDPWLCDSCILDAANSKPQTDTPVGMVFPSSPEHVISTWKEILEYVVKCSCGVSARSFSMHQTWDNFNLEHKNPPEIEKVQETVTLTMPPNIPETARRLVYRYVYDRLEKTDTHVEFELSQVYVVWFSKVLQNWKALISTELPDGMYYEVTHNGDKRETYIDAYKKFDNVCIKDDPPVEEQTSDLDDFADKDMVLLGSQIGPHSRACGLTIHKHGPACSPDCPTCAWIRSQT